MSHHIKFDQAALQQAFARQLDAIQIGTLTHKGQRRLLRDRALQPLRNTTYQKDDRGWLLKVQRQGLLPYYQHACFPGDGLMFAQCYKTIVAVDANLGGPHPVDTKVIITEADDLVQPDHTLILGVMHVDQNTVDLTLRDAVYDIEDDSGLGTVYLDGFRGADDTSLPFLQRHTNYQRSDPNAEDYQDFLEQNTHRLRQAMSFAVTRRYTCTPHTGVHNITDQPIRRRRGRLRIYRPG